MQKDVSVHLKHSLSYLVNMTIPKKKTIKKERNSDLVSQKTKLKSRGGQTADLHGPI